jgi:hypothetical protein
VWAARESSYEIMEKGMELDEKERDFERLPDKDSNDRGTSKAMLSPYYYDYNRVCVMVKQRNIESDAKPVLWKPFKENTLVM